MRNSARPVLLRSLNVIGGATAFSGWVLVDTPSGIASLVALPGRNSLQTALAGARRSGTPPTLPLLTARASPLETLGENVRDRPRAACQRSQAHPRYKWLPCCAHQQARPVTCTLQDKVK